MFAIALVVSFNFGLGEVFGCFDVGALVCFLLGLFLFDVSPVACLVALRFGWVCCCVVCVVD